jgi:hypothetical protein
MEYDIINLADIQILKLHTNDVLKFKCETCGKEVEKKILYFLN